MWPFKKRVETRATFQVGDAWPGPPTWAGVQVNADHAQRHTTVWACVRLLSDVVSTLPVDVYREGSRDPLTLPPLLRSPAAGMDRQQFIEAVMRSLLLRGNAYGLITARSGATLLPSQIELIAPDLVQVRLTHEGVVEYRIGGQIVDPDDVWHVRAYTTPGQPAGLSPVEYARQTIGLGLAAEKFGAQFFGDSATPAGVLTMPGTPTTGQLAAVKEIWHDRYQSARNVAVLAGGMKFEPIAIKPEESQFIETAGLNVRSVCRVFGCPPEMIGAEAGGSLTYANVEMRSLDFLTYSVNPWLYRLEVALSKLLPRNQFVKFNPGGLLRATTKDRYEAHEIALRAGFLTVNEVRALEDLPPIAEGGTAA
jgi:HK97 family phage portal protein